jgi:uncharacterized protein YoxC
MCDKCNYLAYTQTPVHLILSYHSVVSQIRHPVYARLLNTLVPQRKRRLSKDLRTVLETTLRVLAAVDEVGVVESQLNSAVDDVVHSLNTQHERVVLIADLVAPRAEAAT